MECKRLELKSMVCSSNGEVPGRTGTETAGLRLERWTRDQSPQGWLCQSRVWTLLRGTQEPGKAVGRRTDLGLVSVTPSLAEPELITLIWASVSLYVKWKGRSRRDLAAQVLCPCWALGNLLRFNG